MTITSLYLKHVFYFILVEGCLPLQFCDQANHTSCFCRCAIYWDSWWEDYQNWRWRNTNNSQNWPWSLWWVTALNIVYLKMSGSVLVLIKLIFSLDCSCKCISSFVEIYNRNINIFVWMRCEWKYVYKRWKEQQSKGPKEWEWVLLITKDTVPSSKI